MPKSVFDFDDVDVDDDWHVITVRCRALLHEAELPIDHGGEEEEDEELLVFLNQHGTLFLAFKTIHDVDRRRTVAFERLN